MDKHVLHFAPEASVKALIEPFACSYRTADIDEERAEITLNIEKIDLPAASIDVLLCNHVLEHVDHNRALVELYRILRPGGFAILSFPLVEGWIENYDIGRLRTNEDREIHYGQWDHIKIFGANIRNDIRKAGFDLSESTALEPAAHRFALVRGEKLFLASKPEAQQHLSP